MEWGGYRIIENIHAFSINVLNIMTTFIKARQAMYIWSTLFIILFPVPFRSLFLTSYHLWKLFKEKARWMYSVDLYALPPKTYLNLNMIWCYFMEAIRWPYAMTQKTMCSSAYEFSATEQLYIASQTFTILQFVIC